MRINLIDLNNVPKAGETTYIDMWYDPHLRLWELTPKDENGYQTGNTQYVYGKKDALLIKNEMEKEYGI